MSEYTEAIGMLLDHLAEVKRDEAAEVVHIENTMDQPMMRPSTSVESVTLWKDGSVTVYLTVNGMPRAYVVLAGDVKHDTD